MKSEFKEKLILLQAMEIITTSPKAITTTSKPKNHSTLHYQSHHICQVQNESIHSHTQQWQNISMTLSFSITKKRHNLKDRRTHFHRGGVHSKSPEMSGSGFILLYCRNPLAWIPQEGLIKVLQSLVPVLWGYGASTKVYRHEEEMQERFTDSICLHRLCILVLHTTVSIVHCYKQVFDCLCDGRLKAFRYISLFIVTILA